jgi:methyltransferase (TIGR00027 family)
MKEGQPSQTAMLVAFRRLMASLDPVLRPLVSDADDPSTAWFLEAHSPQSREHAAQLQAGSDPPFLRMLRLSAGQGAGLFILLRKRFVEDEVRGALADGAEQVVVFGAGYDPLGVRLAPAFPSVRFFELDYPATLAVKRTALESHGGVPAGLVLLPVDFSRESAEEKLRAADGFRAGARTAFVAEGVLNYLEPADVDVLFASVQRLGGAGSRFIFTAYAGPLTDASAVAGRAAQGLAQMGEPLRSTLDPKALPAFLAQRGFSTRALADHEALRQRYLVPLGLADRALEGSTFLATAERP